MKDLIEKYLDESGIQKLSGIVKDATDVISPVSISLDDSQRRGLRTMADNREGVSRTVSKVALTFEECLPRNEDPKQMEAALDYYEQLTTVRIQLSKLYEMVNDTLGGLGNDLMGMLDRYSTYLQAARKKNANLDMALAPVDEYNKRFARRKEDEEETPVEPQA